MQQQIKRPIKIVMFTNWTTEDFTHTWDSVPYTVKAGETSPLPDYLAEHLAKHLVTRELNKLDKQANDPSRLTMEAKCLGKTTEEVNEAKAQIAIESMKLKHAGTNELKPELKLKNKGGRPRKVKEEEFEGLKDEK